MPLAGRVFLDVDGVVCLFKTGLSAAPLGALEQLFARSEAELDIRLQLVVSSTWRTRPKKLRQLAAAIARHPLLPPLDPANVDATPVHNDSWVAVDVERAAEISAFIVRSLAPLRNIVPSLIIAAGNSAAVGVGRSRRRIALSLGCTG